MEVRDIRYRPDWPSRVLAIFALILAGLAVGYVVMQGQLALTQDALVQQFDQRLAQQIQTRQPQFDDLLANLRQSATEMRTAADQQKQSFDTLLTQTTNQLSSLEQKTAEVVTAKVDELDKAADLQERITSLEASWNRLRLARPEIPATGSGQADDDLDLKATGHDAEVEIVNLSTADITIDAVRFVPRSETETTKLQLTKSIVAAGNVSSSPLEIVFAPHENSDAAAGTHGVYTHRLVQPLKIQPNGRSTVRLAIGNSKHTGFALIGDLVLLQGEDEVQRTGSVAAPFVAK